MSRDISLPFIGTAGISRHPALVEIAGFAAETLFEPADLGWTGLSGLSDISWFCDVCDDQFLTLASREGGERPTTVLFATQGL